MKFCSKCGKELMDEAVFCPGCGCAVSGANMYKDVNVQQMDSQVLLRKLQRKLKAEIQLWMCIGIAQAVIGLILLVNALDGEFFIGLPISLFVISIVNLCSSAERKKFSRAIDGKPVGIVKRYEPFYTYVLNFAYNLIFGGVIGIAGSIYGIMTRNFVLKNESAFLTMEKECTIDNQ
ncbi:MAG: zinc-ribbon domain-containing protein [Oscillospiraceae bacterium]|nr:zinc-ribbon domain-containing protein [Oscillospiraceae bacterium]